MPLTSNPHGLRKFVTDFESSNFDDFLMTTRNLQRILNDQSISNNGLSLRVNHRTLSKMIDGRIIVKLVMVPARNVVYQSLFPERII